VKKIIAFDLDDTLYDEIFFVKSGFNAVNNFLRNQFNYNEFYDHAWDLFLKNEEKIFDKVIKESNIEYSKVIINKMIEIYRNHKPKIHLYEDAEWALNYLYKKFDLILISDGYLDTQKNKFKALNLEKYFKKKYFTDEWGTHNWKPNQFIFQKAQFDFNKDPSMFTYVADNPEKDFVGTNATGWNSIYIKRENGVYSKKKFPPNGLPDTTILSLFEIKKFF